MTRKVDDIMKFFTKMFNPVFDYPPKTLSIAEPNPIKLDGLNDSKKESKRQPLTKAAPVAGATLEAKKPLVLAQKEQLEKIEDITCPVQITVGIEKKEVQKPKEEASYKSGSKQKNDDKKAERKQDMSEKRKGHDEYCHDDHHDKYYCPPFPEVPVVLKGFEWCDYYYHKDEIEKFIHYIKEYQCKYPCVVIKYKKAYPTKCKVHIYVWFSLCEYEKAFEIEEKLQKKYREMKMHDYHEHKY